MARRYDTIIVGAGSAGCVLASRLTENPLHTVLLVESGSSQRSTGGADGSFLAADPASGREHDDIAVELTSGASARRYRAGRGLGGTSAINGMIATWGRDADYDHWATDLRCRDWAWSDVAATFASSAIPLSQPQPDELGAVGLAVIEAAQQLGHPFCADYLDPVDGSSLGVGPAWLTRDDGRRVTAADAYVEPARDRRNLTIRGRTDVASIILEERTAVGVTFADGSIAEAAEVIVCAGAINSPLLLLRSGVARSGIGRGLRDHPSARLTLGLREPADTSALAATTLLRWSSPGGDADLQLLPMNHVGVPEYGALLFAVMQPHSTGSVSIESNGAPVVRFDMLQDERDRRRLRDATRHVALLAATTAIDRIADAVFVDDAGTTVDALPHDDDALDRWLLANVGDFAHASSTCRMGPISDDGSVVDLAGRVHGYIGLRVCDASIFPDLPRANPYLPTVMVAERIAATITRQFG